MNAELTSPLITTIREQCKMCYTCVRECPAKAIRITSGQAEVINDKCIGCGNCVRVCSQKAKKVRDSIESVKKLLSSGKKTAAIIAPSFPAEYEDMNYRKLVGIFREVGFDYVYEVAVGADLVAAEYDRLLRQNPDCRYIATSCPALIQYVSKYYPNLVDFLAPVVSPMVATARLVKGIHNGDINIIFIGPCIAKKEEAADELINSGVDNVLTFAEFREMIREKEIKPEWVKSSEFDPPYPKLGVLFPLSRGMLQAAGLEEDLIEGGIVVADGRANFVEAIKEFEIGALKARLLEVLCCNGCIMGAGSTSRSPLFRRRALVSKYSRERIENSRKDNYDFSDTTNYEIDLSRIFAQNDKRLPLPSDSDLANIFKEMGKLKPEDELNCGACGYETCYEHAIAIARGLAETEMCLPYTIECLNKSIKEIEDSHEKLTSVQEALMQTERLASMGQLAAGIAHEVNNPLGIVLMYTHMLLERTSETTEEYSDLKTIVEEADRCKKIISGLLNFVRKNELDLKTTKLSELIDHCVEIIPTPDNILIKTEHKIPDLKIDIDRDQIIQVLTNMINNAIAAMASDGRIEISTSVENDWCNIAIKDTGSGIPKEIIGKIFEPFFSTKKPGKGTGLGLSVAYGIIKMHRGIIMVESNNDPASGPLGSTFTIKLPCNTQECRCR